MEQFVAHLIALLAAIYSSYGPATDTTTAAHHPAVTIPEYAPDTIQQHPGVTIPEYAPVEEDWSEEGFVEDETPISGDPEGSVAPELVEDGGDVGASEDS